MSKYTNTPHQITEEITEFEYDTKIVDIGLK